MNMDALIRNARRTVQGAEEAQYRLLKQVVCDIIQGYYFSRPVDAKQFEAFLT